jgi:hypothetical protein
MPVTGILAGRRTAVKRAGLVGLIRGCGAPVPQDETWLPHCAKIVQGVQPQKNARKT